ncbi:MAG: RNA-binding protein [Mesorhizobium sp.]|nr:MAG: RNA-binding protein [Mesorhizobium sp.]
MEDATGPKGQKRPADVIGNAVRVMRIAVGEAADELLDDGKDPAAKALGAKGERSMAGSLERLSDKPDGRPPPWRA